MNDMTVPTQATLCLKDEERTRCEVWTRVMGYHRPVTSFNKGKKSEHRERRFFVEARNDERVGMAGQAEQRPSTKKRRSRCSLCLPLLKLVTGRW